MAEKRRDQRWASEKGEEKVKEPVSWTRTAG